MATYKAEFLSHYYERYFPPRTAYAFGFIHWWARAAANAPSLVNWTMSAPGLGALATFLSGASPKRRLPKFAPRTFVQWQAARACPLRRGGDRVVLWPDTFNNHFHPGTAIAALDLLEDAGFDVIVPAGPVCCGRPLYDYGFLDLAKRMLLRVLDAVRDEIRAGTPVVVLEPSCAAVFRDELPNMLPHDRDAARLASQVTLLAPFVAKHRDRFDLAPIAGDVLFHGHCHQKAVFGVKDDHELLKSLGARVDAPDTGCCGMAGSFGFEAGHYDVSIAVGERVLLPAARKLDHGAILVADGFSCREQLAQAAGRRALHLAEVLRRTT
jgi:Fe-S oxidoreductase